MSNIQQTVPDDLTKIWNELAKEMKAKSFHKHLETLKSNIEDAQNLANSMQNQFGTLAPENVDPNSRLIARKNLVTSLQVHTLTISSLQSVFSNLSSTAKGLVQSVLDWIIQNVVQVLSSFSQHLSVDTWSVEATGGLPLGVSFSITITFK